MEARVCTAADKRHTDLATALLLCVAFASVLWGTFIRMSGDATNSRLATVWSLTERGTWQLDVPVDQWPNVLEFHTVDKVMIDGHIYSSKPPVMPLVMTGEYLVLKTIFGLDLMKDADVPRVARCISLTLVGLPYVLAILFFLRTLEFYIPDARLRLFLGFVLAFGTQLWGYSTNINNHMPGAFLTIVSVYFATGLVLGKLAPRPWRFAMFGLCAALTFTVDMPATVFVAIAGLYLAWNFPKPTFTWSLLGASIPLVVHFAVMTAVTGSPFPVQTREDIYRFRMSYWRHPVDVDSLNEPKGDYLFSMTFGRVGLFSLYPILLIGVAAAVRALFRPSTLYRGPILAAFGGFLIMTLYYLLKTNNYGGQAYGFRWYIPAMPILLLMGAPLLSKLRSRGIWALLVILLLVSTYSSWECWNTPWRANTEWTTRILGPSYE